MARFTRELERVEARRVDAVADATFLLMSGAWLVVELWFARNPEPRYAVPFVLGALALAARDVLDGRWSVPGQRRQRRVRVEADGEGLRLDGRLEFPREALEFAYFHAPLEVVRLRGRGLRRCELHVTDAAVASELLDALRVGSTESVARFDVRPDSAFAFILPAIVYVGWCVGGTTWGLAYVASAVGVAFAVILLFFRLPSSVIVGADGLFLSSVLRERFLPTAEIEAVAREDGRLVVRLQRGEQVTLQRGSATQDADGTAMAARIQESLARRTHDGADEELAEKLARGAHSGRDWLDALAGLATRTAYRAGSLPLDRLWAVVLDPSPHARVRAAAAASLRLSLDDDGRQRMLAAAAAAASPRTRVALEAAATGGDDDMIRALEACDDAMSVSR